MKNVGLILLGLTLAGGLLAAGLAGCKTRGPMSESEFIGFCAGEGGHRDTCGYLGTCENYRSVVGKSHKDLQSCLDDCSELTKQMKFASNFGRCAAAIENGGQWCQRFCRTQNYPQP